MTNKDDLAAAYDKLRAARLAHSDALTGFTLARESGRVQLPAWRLEVGRCREAVDDAIQDLVSAVADYLGG